MEALRCESSCWGGEIARRQGDSAEHPTEGAGREAQWVLTGGPQAGACKH